MSRPQLIVIDLDGTLVDSAPDLIYAAKEMMREIGREPVDPKAIRGWVGNGVSMLVKRVLAGRKDPPADAPEFERAYAVFAEIYAANLSRHSRVYPGVFEGLKALQQNQFTLACITNKHSRFTTSLLEKFRLLDYFDRVVSGDTYAQRKPHPMPLLKTAERFNILPTRSAMVGDSLNDIQAAKAAGFVSVCVPYGYHGNSRVEELGADHIVESIADLPRLFAAGL